MSRFRCVAVPGLAGSFAFFLAFGVCASACSSNAGEPAGAGSGGMLTAGGAVTSPGGVSGSTLASAGTTSAGSGGAASAGEASTMGGSAAGGVASGGVTSGGSAAGGAPALDPNKRKLLLRDEGNSAVHYVDLADAGKNWHQAVPTGRDLQVIGGGHFLIGTDNGYQERNLSDGTLVKDVADYPGTLAAHRLHSGNTLLSGVGFHGGKGIVLLEITPQGDVGRQIAYPGNYVRMVRESGTEHFLFTANTQVFEGDLQGNIVWDVKVQGGPADPHAWEALRLASGDVLVSAGYAAGLQVFGADKQLKQTITGGDGATPFYFADVQVMPGGTYVVANWQGHGAGNGSKGLQLLEYDPSGKLVWWWKQDASFVSSLQSVVVLDGLDTSKLAVESRQTGVLETSN